MVLSRNDFEKAKYETKRKKIQNLVTFVKKIPLFYNLTRTYLSKLCLKVEFLEVNKDHVLFKEGDVADKVYIIKSGEFVVTKKLPQAKKKTENIQEILEDPQRACKLNNKFFNKNTVNKIDKFTIAYVGESNIIGIEDVRHPEDAEQFGTYKSQVKCISKEASLMYLHKKDFMALKQQATTWDQLLSHQKQTKADLERNIKLGQKAKKKISDDITSAFVPQSTNPSNMDHYQTQNNSPNHKDRAYNSSIGSDLREKKT